ncbi:serine/threonine-protein kinase-like protein tel1 [Halenospora varia]|nr:serine/threonine-protein kinase-like protein tel1 [Halenospora varia]
MDETNRKREKVRLDKALAILAETESKTKQNDALKSLQQIFHPSNAHNFSVLKDAAWHKVFEVVFSTAVSEKHAYFGTSKGGSSASLTRLTLCADLLRLVVKAAAPKIGARTVKSVVDHITQMVPNADGEFCRPIVSPYVRALCALLEHPANVERLRRRTWLETLNFSLQGLEFYLDGKSTEPVVLSRTTSNPGSSLADRTVPRSSAMNGRSIHPPSSVTKSDAEELIQIVHSLVCASNAPFHDKFREITDSTIRFLHSQGTNVSSMPQLVFSIVNNVLYYTRTDHASFSISLAKELLPVVCRFWQAKAVRRDKLLGSIREEMLIFLLTIHPHLERCLLDEEDDEFSRMIEDMADILRNDYGKRTSRDQLQLGDLDMADLGMNVLNATPFYLDAFRLRAHHTDAERNWAILQMIGILERCVSLGHHKFNKQELKEDLDTEKHPRKRQRLAQGLDRIVGPLKFQDEALRLATLQTLPFILSCRQLQLLELQELLDILGSCASDKRGTIAAWALLAISSCTFQNRAVEIESSQWMSLWHIGTRALTFSGTCRAAALQLHAILARNLLAYREIGEDVSSIITVADASGPVILCDSAIFLMVHLLQVRIAEVPSASLATSHHAIRWMFSRWIPADRIFAAHYAPHVKPHHMVSLLRASLGLPRISMQSRYLLPLGRLEQTWLHHLNTHSVVQYVLLLDDRPRSTTVTCSSCPKYSPADQVQFVLDTANFNHTRKLVLELLIPKCDELSQSWRSDSEDRVSPVSTETFRSAVDSCVVMLLAMPHFSQTGLSKLHNFEQTLKGFSTQIIAYLGDAEIHDPSGARTLTESLLQCVQNYLPPSMSSDLAQLSTKMPHLLQFLVAIAEDLSNRRALFSAVSTGPTVPDSDRMEIDDHFDDFSTQESHGKADKQKSPVPRRNLAIDASAASFYFVAFGHLLLIASICTTTNFTGVVPAMYLEQLIDFSDEELLLARPLLHELVHADLTIDATDSIALIERMGSLMSSDDYDRCEVALSSCLDVLVGLGRLWSSADALPEAVRLSSQLYQYFVERALENNILSPETQKAVANLLLFLLRFEPGYGDRLGFPSARSSLFDLLRSSEISVKFYIGNELASIFHLYVLNDHDDIFIDILATLPSDPLWREGISFRLFIFAKLAAEWPTLLRRCIYHIFEAAGRLSDCIRHATKCLLDVASALKLPSTKELFTLFAPQLLYTWLESEDISSMPFQIFGFSSLRDLVLDAKTEIVALMIMRGQDDSVENVAGILNVEETELLQNCFTKVMAYTIAYDLSVPPPSSEKKYISGEGRVKKRLGQELFFHCINQHFADIIALMFCVCDPQESLERYLGKKKELAYAASIMKEIKSTSTSSTALPANQQPTFKAKYLAAEIQHLCNRTEFEPENLYTSALVTFIARKLFDTIHPALGSLHACSVLRKIRALICLSGNTSIKGYPLEMLLHTVRPFINDPQCADDAVGITQYLLTSGFEHLSGVPSFVAGMSLAILSSMTALLRTDRASSTQESQHETTLSRVRTFKKWFKEYLDKYCATSSAVHDKDSLRALLDAALSNEWIGNAGVGTPESNLLVQLLQDEQMDEKLLTRPSRELAMKALCSEFKGPASFRSDVLGDDLAAIEMAVLVWKSCRDAVGTSYMSWAARVLGRAFVASGHIDQDLLRESSSAQIKELAGSVEEAESSQACVLKLLQELTLGYEERDVGIAEAALRFIMTTSDPVLFATCEKYLSPGLLDASSWSQYQLPPSDDLEDNIPRGDPYNENAIFQEKWLQDLCIVLARSAPKNTLMSALIPVLQKVKGFAERAFPFIIHLVLSTDAQDQYDTKKDLSTAVVTWFGENELIDKNNLRVLINAIIYLRTQPIPKELSSADRLQWLNIDYMKAANAATRCGMYKTALLFAEEHLSMPVKSSRRSSIKDNIEQTELSEEMLLIIFQNIDDPDLYYGVQQKASLKTILARSEYEKDGTKSLAFRGAQYDSHLRKGDPRSEQDARSLVKALEDLSLSGVSHSLLQGQPSTSMTPADRDSMFRTARKLEQWDIPVPEVCNTNSLTIYKAFQTIHTAADQVTIQRAVDEGFHCTISSLVRDELTASDLHESLQTLAALVEVDEILSSNGSQDIEHMLRVFESRSSWMKTGRFDDISQILSCRGTTLSTLSQQPRLQNLLSIEPVDSRLVEVRSSLLASTLNRAHNALQESLSLATSMTHLIPTCQSMALHVDAAIHVEAANALWDQGEMASSIGILQALDSTSHLKKQEIVVGRSDLLSKIGNQVSVARLEKADKILEKYLKPALKELKGKSTGSEAGQVFHQFAVFCDQQLADPDGLEDLERLKKLSKGKKDEVEQWEKLMKSATSTSDRSRYKSHYTKAKTWYRLDEEELQRHISSREEFLRQSLENYLLSLAASDDHNSTALRFSALWLEHADEDLANTAVTGHLNQVPSRKFAPLMNQLASRLQDTTVKFQQLLYNLVLRICTEHPYHGMYSIYGGANSHPSSKDEAAQSRKKAARRVANALASSQEVGAVWGDLNNTSKYYGYLAGEKDEQRYKSGKRVYIKDSRAAASLNANLSKAKIPPPTMQIPLSADMDYSRVPRMVRLEPTMAIASGVSAPKIITALATNGAKFKQLVKGGNDDLRQDAIMEQVFEQVSELLRANRATRQRNLNIRTYKVLPLTSIAGVIEFVPNTIPLHEYLMPAHERYYPKDLKGNQCRKMIGDVQTQSNEVRVKTFRQVADRFHPVMRYFFTEKFTDPDEWFVKRLAYTRSTAAISMLGHVLGLGDRHGHNILLDTQSGEAVHIDLGVAFEMGRVLPVPELVPFRLTRDIVDGMGITKTEGVFRRCCEFTLEALRKESYSIMTILDVLRYDPLYSWSISPVRLAKLQEEQSAAVNADVGERTKEAVNEPGEADRALTVVNKKLSKTLSVQATVNDLINQAGDERNLAVLYSGWAAYA